MEAHKIAQPKDVKITGKVMFKGEMRDIIITKFDTKNNVVGFFIMVFGKPFYIGAGKDTPKLSEVQDITFTFN